MQLKMEREGGRENARGGVGGKRRHQEVTAATGKHLQVSPVTPVLRLRDSLLCSFCFFFAGCHLVEFLQV